MIITKIAEEAIILGVLMFTDPSGQTGALQKEFTSMEQCKAEGSEVMMELQERPEMQGITFSFTCEVQGHDS